MDVIPGYWADFSFVAFCYAGLFCELLLVIYAMLCQPGKTFEFCVIYPLRSHSWDYIRIVDGLLGIGMVIWCH